jgi:hypothetical protein
VLTRQQQQQQQQVCICSGSSDSSGNDAISLTLNSKDAARLVSGAVKSRQQQQ